MNVERKDKTGERIEKGAERRTVEVMYNCMQPPTESGLSGIAVQLQVSRAIKPSDRKTAITSAIRNGEL